MYKSIQRAGTRYIPGKSGCPYTHDEHKYCYNVFCIRANVIIRFHFCTAYGAYIYIVFQQHMMMYLVFMYDDVRWKNAVSLSLK